MPARLPSTTMARWRPWGKPARGTLGRDRTPSEGCTHLHGAHMASETMRVIVGTPPVCGAWRLGRPPAWGIALRIRAHTRANQLAGSRPRATRRLHDAGHAPGMRPFSPASLCLCRGLCHACCLVALHGLLCAAYPFRPPWACVYGMAQESAVALGWQPCMRCYRTSLAQRASHVGDTVPEACRMTRRTRPTGEQGARHMPLQPTHPFVPILSAHKGPQTSHGSSQRTGEPTQRLAPPIPPVRWGPTTRLTSQQQGGAVQRQTPSAPVPPVRMPQTARVMQFQRQGVAHEGRATAPVPPVRMPGTISPVVLQPEAPPSRHTVPVPPVRMPANLSAVQHTLQRSKKEERERKKQSQDARNAHTLARYNPSAAKQIERQGGTLTNAVANVQGNLAHRRGQGGSPVSGTTKKKLQKVDYTGGSKSTASPKQHAPKQHANFYRSQNEPKTYARNKIDQALDKLWRESRDNIATYEKKIQTQWPLMDPKQVAELVREREEIGDILDEHEDVQQPRNEKDHDDNNDGGYSDFGGVETTSQLTTVSS